MKKAVLTGRKLRAKITWTQDFHDSVNPDLDFQIQFRQLSRVELLQAREMAQAYFRAHVTENKPVGAVDGKVVEITSVDGWLLVATLEVAQVPFTDESGAEVRYNHLELAMMAYYDELLATMQEVYYKVVDPAWAGDPSEESPDPLP